MSALSYFNEPAPLAWDVAAAIFGSTGEGGLYDPSALDTIFQDVNGTTPAVPGSPVGLVLDARQEMGPEFKGEGVASYRGTTTPSVYDQETGAGSVTRTSGAGNQSYVTFEIVADRNYKFEVTNTGAIDLALRDGADSGVIKSTISPGQTRTFVSKFSSSAATFTSSADGTTANFIVHSIREVLNPPLSQPTTAARPILARMPLTGRRNLLTWTEDFSNSAWQQTNASIVPASDGFTKVIPAATDASGRHLNSTGIRQNFASLPVGRHTIKAEVRADGANFAFIGLSNLAGYFVGCGYDLINGVAQAPNAHSTTANNLEASIKSLGGGVYECVLSFNVLVADRLYFAHFSCSNSAPSPVGTNWQFADGTSGILIRRPQVNVGDPTPYQHVRSAYDITEAGVPDTYSLVYDLADDALTTTLPQAINGDLLIAGTKGSIIEPVSYAAGSTFAIGPDTYTGGTPGILRAIGDIVGVVLIDRTLTQTERDALIEHYKGKGAKGLLVPGPELVVDLASQPQYLVTRCTTSVDGNAITLTSTESGVCFADIRITTEIGKNYVQSGEISSLSGGSSYLGYGSGVAYIPGAVTSATFTKKKAVITANNTANTIRFRTDASAAGQQAAFRNISLRELRPQEDW